MHGNYYKFLDEHKNVAVTAISFLNEKSSATALETIFAYK